MRWALRYTIVFFVAIKAIASPGTESASFLNIPVGAGPAALGSAYAAMANDAYAPVYNPAGLAALPNTQIAAQQLSYLESLNYEYLSAVHPLPGGKGIGFSAQYLGTGSIGATGVSGESLGTYSDHFGAYSLAYGQKLGDKFSVGVTGKWINEQLANVSANAYATDIGGLYQASEHLKLALTADNLGSKVKFISQSDALPQAAHFGAAYQPDNHLNLAAEGIYSGTGLLSGRFGMEWSPLDMLKLRAGYRTDTLRELSPVAGVTAGIGLNMWGQEFSYAWLPYGDLGDTQYFSLLIRFGAPKELRRNLIYFHEIKTRQFAERHADVNNQPVSEDQLLELLLADREIQISQNTNTAGDMR